MTSAIDDLIAVSRRIGARVPHWTQGAGGNASVKEGDALYIKPSGLRMDQVTGPADVVDVPASSVRTALEAIAVDDAGETRYADALRRRPSSPLSTRRPSMETGMHLFLPRPWAIHFHSLTALIIAHERRKAPEEVDAWLARAGKFRSAVLPPVRPGLFLCDRVRRHADATFLILENHGVLIQGDSPEIVDEWDALERRFQADWKCETVGDPAKNEPTPLRIYFPDSAVFLDRLRKVLRPAASNGEALFTLDPSAAAADRDAAELWQATEILHRTRPALENLPAEVAGSVANLPTELYRREAR